MISSLARISLAGLTASVISVALIATPVIAQNKPRSLVPLPSQDQIQPSSDNSAIPTADPPKAQQDLFAPEPTSGMQVQALDAVHPASVNLLSAEQGGLGYNLWKGTRPELVAELLSRLTAPTGSPAMMSVYRKLLLTGGDLPDGLQDADKIMEIRLRKIMDQGWFESAENYFGRIPASRRTATVNQLHAELKLLTGREAEACADLKQSLQRDGGNAFWAKLDVYCKLAEQDFDRADLEIALLEEKGEDDPLFFSLAAAVQGSKVDLSARTEALQAVSFALLKRLDAGFPASLAKNASLPVKRAMLESPGRLQGAKMAVALNVIQNGHPAAEVAGLLSAEGAVVAADAATDDGIVTYRRLLQAISAAPTPEEKAQLLDQLWSEAEAGGELFAVSKMTMPLLADLPVAAQDQAFMRKAVSLLLASGNTELALQWERASRRAAIQGTAEDRVQARRDISRLDLYILLSGVDGIARWNAQSFDAWLEAVGDDPMGGRKGAYLLMAMEVFGYSVRQSDWDRLLYLEQPPIKFHSNHAFENILVTSALNKAVGKSVSLSVMTMGTEAPDLVSLTSVRAVLSALKALGLEEDARKLALEIAILKDL